MEEECLLWYQDRRLIIALVSERNALAEENKMLKDMIVELTQPPKEVEQPSKEVEQ
jgi:hypothetical protein